MPEIGPGQFGMTTKNTVMTHPRPGKPPEI
jgi:hypothetical protein